MTASQLIITSLPRLTGSKPTGTTFYDAINYMISMISRRLLYRESDLVKTSVADFTVTPTTDTYNLPADFIALAEKPRTSHHRQLEPVDDEHRRHHHHFDCEPRRYELIGSTIIFHPKLDDNVTSADVRARYFSKPAAVALPADNIPFNGLFDEVFYQGVPRVIAKGLAVVQADPDFERFIFTEVDSVIDARSVPLPDKRTSRRNFI